MSRKIASTSVSRRIRRPSVAVTAVTTSPMRSSADSRYAELVERRLLVVDQQHPEPRPWGGHTLTPGANFGTRTITLVPAPGAVSTTRP